MPVLNLRGYDRPDDSLVAMLCRNIVSTRAYLPIGVARLFAECAGWPPQFHVIAQKVRPDLPAMTHVDCSDGKQILEWIGTPARETCFLLRGASVNTGEMR
jgi:hypothetical protein